MSAVVVSLCLSINLRAYLNLSRLSFVMSNTWWKPVFWLIKCVSPKRRSKYSNLLRKISTWFINACCTCITTYYSVFKLPDDAIQIRIVVDCSAWNSLPVGVGGGDYFPPSIRSYLPQAATLSHIYISFSWTYQFPCSEKCTDLVFLHQMY